MGVRETKRERERDMDSMQGSESDEEEAQRYEMLEKVSVMSPFFASWWRDPLSVDPPSFVVTSLLSLSP